MAYKIGVFVKHPSHLEWGIGKIVLAYETRDIGIYFPKAGIKTIRPSKAEIPFDIFDDPAEALAELHRCFLESKGLPYRGTRPIILQ